MAQLNAKAGEIQIAQHTDFSTQLMTRDLCQLIERDTLW